MDNLTSQSIPEGLVVPLVYIARHSYNDSSQIVLQWIQMTFINFQAN